MLNHALSVELQKLMIKAARNALHTFQQSFKYLPNDFVCFGFKNIKDGRIAFVGINLDEANEEKQKIISDLISDEIRVAVMLFQAKYLIGIDFMRTKSLKKTKRGYPIIHFGCHWQSA